MHQPRKPWTPQSRRALREVLAHPSHERAVQLAGSRNPAVRTALAGARETPIGVLIHLSTDPEPAVRAAVAGNQAVAVSVSTVRRLASDRDPGVRAALAGNLSVPLGLKEQTSIAV